MRIDKTAITYPRVLCALVLSASFMLNAKTTEPVAAPAQPIMTVASTQIISTLSKPAESSKAAVSAKVESSSVEKASVESSSIDTQDCPSTFYSITLPQNGKLCQVFAADLPASMIFYVPQSPSEVVQYFKQHHGPAQSAEASTAEGSNKVMFSTSKQVKSRFLLHSDDKNTTIVISSDGEGTQVDVLVKNDSV